jgi:hypothetical protein
MTQANNLQDLKINIKFKLSALWISLMFCYIYGDFFSLFVPGRITGLINGRSGAGPTTPTSLLMFAILMTLPSIMVFLSLVLRPKVNRITNIILGIFFTLIMLLVVATSISKWMTFYTYLGAIEMIISCAIVWHAWLWPKQEDLV